MRPHALPQLILGRAADCNVVLTDGSVSSRHARLSWRNGLILVEDLASANGVWVRGQRVRQVMVRPGEEVLLGGAAIPWSDPAMGAFLRLGAGGTRVASAGRMRWVRVRSALTRTTAVLVTLLCALGIAALFFPMGREALRDVGDKIAATIRQWQPTNSQEEAYLRSRVAARMQAAIDPTNPTTRSAAVQIASRQQGTFRVEQVAAIWDHVRTRWRYVNDPQGREYFATAHETIGNNYAGDCDDFAITLAAMVGAIGGEARVVFMEGPQGGHAYAEACIREEATDVAAKLARYYGSNWARYAGPRRQIAFRRSDTCPVWLNLDWNARVPGGDYEPEQWAVAIYPNGTTETLGTVGTAGTPATGTRTPAGAAAGAPRTLPTPSR